MSVHQSTDLYWDPYDAELNMDPYPLFRRLRDEAPLYYNEQHDFYALSRADDVERAFRDAKRLISGRSDILEFIKSGMQFPPGIFIFEDPPQHTMHRRLVSRVFGAKAMAALEDDVRSFCARCLDPLVGSGGFDFVKDYGDLVAARVIGLLLGIPERDQAGIKNFVDEASQDGSEPLQADALAERLEGDVFAEYIDWRVDHPSDDLMTALLNVEFEDDHGTVRHLTRGEILTFVTLLAGAGNDTTAKLIGWTGELLSRHPGQRRELAENPSLIPEAVEELLRYESPGMQNARYAAEDVDFPGGTVPAGGAVVCIMAAANHDDRRFPDPERFDIHRKPVGHLTFSLGTHFCLGASLARLQGRVALEEVLKRFPEWTVDTLRAVLRPTSTTRGWVTLPVSI
jgi:cytochrome P450